MGLSGSLLALAPPRVEPEKTESLAASTVPERSEALFGAVRVLHGGESAKVSQLYAEGPSSCTGGAPSASPASDAAASAAKKVQRAWKARRARRSERLAAWQDSILQPYVPGGSPQSADPSTATVAPDGGAVGGEASGPGDGGGGGGGVGTPSASAARRKRHNVGALPGGNGSRDRDGDFSVLDSLDALDAADRVLRLSVANGDTSEGSRAVESGQNWWKQERHRQGTAAGAGAASAAERGDGAYGGASGEASGNESDGAKALVRATDALIMETLPVLRRTRSLQAFTSPAESPQAEKMATAASVPAGWDDATGRGARLAATLETKSEMEPEMDMGGFMGASSGRGGARGVSAEWARGGLEEGEEGVGMTVASGVLTPLQPPSPAWGERGRQVSFLWGVFVLRGKGKEGRRLRVLFCLFSILYTTY